MISTKEHIPAKNLFQGYDEKYKVNRITVSACLKCNGQYSPTDEEFRNMIGIISRKKENNQITEKTVRSVVRNDLAKTGFTNNATGNFRSVDFSNSPIENYHKKNFKGLFYHQYKKPLTDDYKLFVNIDKNDWSEQTLYIKRYLEEYFNSKCSGHPDILEYVIQPFRPEIKNFGKKDLEPKENENIFAGYLKYNREHLALVIALRK